MTKPHSDQIEECKSIFPTWTWVLGFILSGVLVVGASIYSYATSEATQQSTLKDHEVRLEKVEKSIATIDVINNNLDTLIKRK